MFDHHAGEAPDWALPDNVVISEDGALTTTLVGILAEREVAVSPLEATIFALGIHEDTGSLTYPSTTQRDADALSWCLRHGARQELLESYLHTPLAPDERELLDALIDALETHELPAAWPCSSRRSAGRATWRESRTSRTRSSTSPIAAASCCSWRWIGASSASCAAVRTAFDAAAAAAALGGGGHEQAASAIFRGPLAEARKELLAALPAAVQEPLRARDVMSQPARTVSPTETVAEAMTLCQRYGQSGVLVLDDGRLVGSVGREDLDRAIGHGLSHAPVKGIMSGRVPTASRGSRSGGAPAAADRVRRGEDRDRGRGRRDRRGHAEGRPARARRARRAGARDRGVDRRGAAATSSGSRRSSPPSPRRASGVEGVYLVGGTVRDILLGEQSFDVDIAVEGDAIALARRIARELGGRTREHEKFGTAVVVYGDGQRVDVVTARTEFYDAPAALPAVEHASIREDLYRRDFTVNAMAASLKAEDFGRLVDPFGGRRDLAAETVRVLHNLSFIEDPTRIFRAIRYENRYGFRMDEHTARLARSLRGDGTGGRPVLGAIARRADGAAGGR